MTNNREYVDRYVRMMRSIEPSEELRQRIVSACLAEQSVLMPSKPAIAAVSCTVVILAVGTRLLYARRKRAQ